jgi:hypothetical protein
MAVTGTAKERVGLRESRLDGKERWYKRTFLVRVTDHKDDAVLVGEAFGLPRYGFMYVTEKSYDKKALCYQLSCKQTSMYTWEVEAEYSSDPSKFAVAKTGSKDDGNDDPLFDPPEYTWGVTNIREVVTGQSTFEERYKEDDPSVVTLLDSTGIVNSAYQPYIPPAEIDRAIPTLTVQRNEPVFNHKYMLQYVNAVNSVKWFGWHKRCVKCASISGSLKMRLINAKKIQKYWSVTYVFQFNKLTWDLFLLDFGSYYLEGGKSAVPLVRKPWLVKGVPQLTLLTSDGDRSTSISRYNRYQVLEKLNFSRLNIPLIT